MFNPKYRISLTSKYFSDIKKLDWFLVTIDDPNFLPGLSIQKIIKLFITIIKFEFVTFNYLDGASLGCLEQKENIILSMDELMKELLPVEQIVWGNFFLFKEFPETWTDQKKLDYPIVIAKTDTTIRAVDGQYIYVYTTYQELVDLLKANYIIESITQGSLSALPYPE
jgi:hypothetical protein